VLAVAVLAPPALVKKIRFDVEHPHDGFLLAASRDLAGLLPPSAHLDLVDPNGSYSDLVLVRFQLMLGRQHAAPGVSATIRGGDLATATADVLGPYVWLADGSPALRDIFGLDLPQGAGYLLRREAGGFVLVHRWPLTAQTQVFAPVDFE